MSKKYAIIETYGKVIVPVSLLEKFTQECYVGRTEWVDQLDVLTKVESIDKVCIIDQKDIDTAKAQMALQGEN